MQASTPVLTLSSIIAITVVHLQAHASEICGGERCSTTSPITITDSDQLTEQAGAACRRTFGASAAVRRIDRAKKYIYCADGNNDNDVMRIKFRFGASKPKQPPLDVAPVLSPTIEDSVITPDTSTVGNDPVVTSRPPNPPVTEQNGRFPKGAEQFCVSRFGPSSTVNHIDYENWQVVCNK